MLQITKKGSLTVFAAISFMLVAQFLFTVIEAARYVEIKKVTAIQSRSELESVFAEYCCPLWDEYRMLAVDSNQTYMQEMVKNISDVNSVTGTNLGVFTPLNLVKNKIDSTSLSRYELVTDQEGAIYARLISSYMKNNVVYEAARRLYDDYNAMSSLTGDESINDSSIDGALDVIEHPENYQNTENTEATNVTRAVKREDNKADNIVKNATAGSYKQALYGSSGDTNNMLNDVKSSKSRGILAIVLDENASVSVKSIELNSLVSHRDLEKGLNPENPSVEWMDKILVEQYMETYMGNYLRPKANRALDYEFEYLIAGKSSDVENLKAVVNRLLAIREAANVMYILSDATKMEEVLALATAIGGATLNPAAILLLKAGLIAAWAYCESVLDVRALLQGDKIPMIKSRNSWTSSISGISELLSRNLKAKNDSHGMSYQTYLGFMLMTEGTNHISKRSMDIQEKKINSIEGYKDLRMDKLVCAADMDICYEYSPVFFSLVSLIQQGNGKLKIRHKVSYSYY